MKFVAAWNDVDRLTESPDRQNYRARTCLSHNSVERLKKCQFSRHVRKYFFKYFVAKLRQLRGKQVWETVATAMRSHEIRGCISKFIAEDCTAVYAPLTQSAQIVTQQLRTYCIQPLENACDSSACVLYFVACRCTRPAGPLMALWQLSAVSYQHCIQLQV